MWDLSTLTRIEHISPAFKSEFLTTGQPRKSQLCFYSLFSSSFFFNNMLISHSSFLLENNSLVSGLAGKSLGYRMRSVMSYTRLCVWSVSPILFSPLSHDLWIPYSAIHWLALVPHSKKCYSLASSFAY